MDWVSFLWGVGVIVFVNIVYTIYAVPKQLKQRAEIEKRYSTLDRKYDSFLSEHEKEIESLEKKNDEVMLTIETLQSSLKLRKSCPACGYEFTLYLREENIK